MGWNELYDLSLHGFVDLDMAREADLTRWQVRHRSTTDQWEPQPAGGWRLPGYPATPRFRLVAAVRGAGPDAVADRHSALALHGLAGSFPTTPQLLLPHECRVRTLPDVDVRRSRRLLTVHLDEVDGIPTVTAPRAIADLAATLDTRALRSLALAAQRERLITATDLGHVVDAMPRNLPGRSRLRQVLHDLGTDGSESGFEFTTRRRMATTGLRPDPHQPTVMVAGVRRRIDIAWVVLRVGVECQGYRAHTGSKALDRDAGRLNALVAGGDWVILQLTQAMLHDDWNAFLADLHHCLRRRATELGLPLPAGVPAA